MERGRMGELGIQSNPIPTNWRITIVWRFSHWSESSEPHVGLPSLRVWEDNPPEHLSLKANGA